MYHFKKGLLVVLIASFFASFSIIFYRYTVVKLNMLNQSQVSLLSCNAKINTIRGKLNILKKDESLVHSIDTNVKTNFKINLSSNSLKELIGQIDSLYGSGIVVVKNAKVQSGNNTLNCTIEGIKIGL
ncbi:hypothetical protein DESAMIL20_1668 [Desulfurella amilsii]|uniref:Uncharacterized protein n=1 Tax=Desulfurella amilsii TaxID=1562698 RepID=A0A1X4XX64_9BACT|nr:hypothetical protein [Desulfurella amilsii]OSS42115.1 hypothetical protein DESAMIL20_1668 [Desulfurella amilsii]